MSEIYWDNIPDVLRELPNWVMWRFQTVRPKSGDERKTKVPFRADLKGKAASDDPGTWAPFEAARTAFEAGDFDGVGFMLGASDAERCGLVGVDLDHCFNPETGEIAAWALGVVNALSTYSEITPSGEGLRCYGWGALPPQGRKKGDFECYQSRRFFTVTGRALHESPAAIADIQEALIPIHAGFFPPPAPSEPRAPVSSGSVLLDDQTLLDKMFASKKGSQWRALYEGQYESYYSSQSEADSALCFTLAFWAGRDGTAIDRVFRTSGLMRDKWDERRSSDGSTYGELTVAHAVNKTSNTYDPAARKVILRGRAARRFAKGENAEEASESNEESGGADEEERVLNNGLYAVEDGRTVLRTVKTVGRGAEKQSVEEYHPVADLAATISQEYRDEGGKAIFGIEGRTRSGRPFTIEIDAEKITDPRIVAAALSNVADAECVFYAGKEKHLSPAIKSFSVREEVESWRRFTRTGWTRDGKEFLIPGMEASDVSLALPRKLAYGVALPEVAELSRAAKALRALLNAQRTEATCVCLAHFLAAPMGALCDWHGERSALFITGRTGSFKSAWATLAMCVYGPDFQNEDNILKFGAGASNNSRMKFFTSASDLPCLVDNYKPNMGKGEAELVELIHLCLEGGEKDRLERTAEFRPSAPIHTWPIFTGEDTVHDAAAAARCLIVPFPLAPEDEAAITLAQTLAPDLHFIGGALIAWLLTPAAQHLAKHIRSQYVEKRREWAAFLRAKRPDMVNIYRVASNLAVNECAWEFAMCCPALGPMLSPLSDTHARGLVEVAALMGQHTAQSVEANRYMDALRALLTSDQAYLCPRLTDPDPDERRRKIGWEDDAGVYLIPEVAFKAACDMTRDAGALNGQSKATIHKQMEQLGYLVRRGKEEFTVRVGTGYNSKVVAVLHVKPSALWGEGDSDES